MPPSPPPGNPCQVNEAAVNLGGLYLDLRRSIVKIAA